MRPILCHHIVRLFQISDVLTSVQYPFICSQHVCKRHFSTTQKMAHGESHSQENTFMVVGLGNLDMPKTRHSVGMQMTDEIALRCKTRFTRNKQCQSMEATADVNGVSLILIKPKLPMNLNGKCVAKAMKHHNIHKDNLILIHDNLDQKLGRFTLKENGGSPRGHNGVKSVAACVPEGKSIARLSIGIDRPTSSDQDVIVDYVLGVFKTYEQDVIEETIDNAIVVLADYISKRTSKNKSNVRVSIGIGKPESSSRGSLKCHVRGLFTTYEQDGVLEILDAAIIILGEYLSKKTSPLSYVVKIGLQRCRLKL